MRNENFSQTKRSNFLLCCFFKAKFYLSLKFHTEEAELPVGGRSYKLRFLGQLRHLVIKIVLKGILSFSNNSTTNISG